MWCCGLAWMGHRLEIRTRICILYYLEMYQLAFSERERHDVADVIDEIVPHCVVIAKISENDPDLGGSCQPCI
jgi:hypothetical protein